MHEVYDDLPDCPRKSVTLACFADVPLDSIDPEAPTSQKPEARSVDILFHASTDTQCAGALEQQDTTMSSIMYVCALRAPMTSDLPCPSLLPYLHVAQSWPMRRVDFEMLLATKSGDLRFLTHPKNSRSHQSGDDPISLTHQVSISSNPTSTNTSDFNDHTPCRQSPTKHPPRC